MGNCDFDCDFFSPRSTFVFSGWQFPVLPPRAFSIYISKHINFKNSLFIHLGKGVDAKTYGDPWKKKHIGLMPRLIWVYKDTIVQLRVWICTIFFSDDVSVMLCFFCCFFSYRWHSTVCYRHIYRSHWSSEKWHGKCFKRSSHKKTMFSSIRSSKHTYDVHFPSIQLCWGSSAKCC